MRRHKLVARPRENIVEPGQRAPRRRRCRSLEYRARRRFRSRRPCMGWRRLRRGRGGRRRRRCRPGPARARSSPRRSWARQRGGHVYGRIIRNKHEKKESDVRMQGGRKGMRKKIIRHRIRAFLVLGCYMQNIEGKGPAEGAQPRTPCSWCWRSVRSAQRRGRSAPPRTACTRSCLPPRACLACTPTTRGARFKTVLSVHGRWALSTRKF